MGEMQVGIEVGCGPNFSDFDSPMIRGIIGNKVRFGALFEIELKIFKDSGLITLNGKVVMGIAVFNHVVGNCTLSQQGIGGNVLTLDIDGIEQGDSGFYFVGALGLFVVVSGEETDFFWV